MKLQLETKLENESSRVNLVFLKDKLYGEVLYYPGDKTSETIVGLTNKKRKTISWDQIIELDNTGSFDITIKNRY